MSAKSSLSNLFENVRIASGLSIRKPMLLKKMMLGYVRSLNRDIGSLRFMDIALSYACNFKCEHCSAEALKDAERSPLSYQEYAIIAQQAIAEGVLAFHFTGGEPLIKHDLLNIIKLFAPSESLISIQTNGWHVTGSFVDEFKRIGGDIICISVDSAKSQEHDEFRCQKGAWERAIEGLVIAKRAGLRILMSATLTHRSLNSGEFDELVKLSHQLGAVLSINLAVPAGNWKGNEEQLLTVEDRSKLNGYLERYRHIRTDFESNWHIRGCPAIKEKCYLSPYGDVLPCPFIQISFGNIRENSLREIRNHALSHRYLQQYHSVCIAAEDRYFIQNAGCYDASDARLPLPSSKSPLFGPR